MVHPLMISMATAASAMITQVKFNRRLAEYHLLAARLGIDREFAIQVLEEEDEKCKASPTCKWQDAFVAAEKRLMR